MKRALGAITDWDTFSKSTSGEYSLEDGRQSVEATKSIERGNAFRRASLLHSAAVINDSPSKSKTSDTSGPSPLDAHQGPHPTSDHASG